MQKYTKRIKIIKRQLRNGLTRLASLRDCGSVDLSLAMSAQCAVPFIKTAVSFRDMSDFRTLRKCQGSIEPSKNM